MHEGKREEYQLLLANQKKIETKPYNYLFLQKKSSMLL